MKIENNVNSFMDRCSKIVGRFEEDNFSQEMFYCCSDGEMESPIEQILYMAINIIIKINYINTCKFIFYEGKEFFKGILIVPQYPIDKYRVDFLITDWNPIKTDNGYYQGENTIIIECDSQAFHERTERERRYEKQRDRYLQSKGYKVFRFTGSEIVNEPFRVAKEIIAFITEQKVEDLIGIENYDLDEEE